MVINIKKKINIVVVIQILIVSSFIKSDNQNRDKSKTAKRITLFNTKKSNN